MKFKLKFKLLLIFAFVLICAILFYFSKYNFDFQKIMIQVAALGKLAPLVYMLFYFFAVLFCFPTLLLNLGAGYIFGFYFGSFYACFGILLGSIISFLFIRFWGRKLIQPKIQKIAQIQAINLALIEDGLKMVFFLRISPIFPLCLTNYILALSEVSFKNYCLGSLGIWFWTINHVYLGSLMSDLSHIAQHKKLIWPKIIGLVLSFIAIAYLAHKANKKLSQLPKNKN